MSNMGYCRFRNTLQDLRDCYENLETFDDLGDEEKNAAIDLLKLCQRITDDYEDFIEDFKKNGAKEK